MSSDRALALATGSFVLFAVVVLVVFAALDFRPLLAIGPLLAVAAASVGVYVAARDEAS